jgi:2-dehydropantoate 2-reductase
MLNESGIEAKVNPDVDRVIWAKVSFNCAMNSLCALLGLTPGPVLDSDELRDVAVATAMESCDVAAAVGVEVDREALMKTLDFVRREHRYHKPSMLVDLMASRRTEIDSLNGAVVALGAAHGVATPRNQTLLALVHAREAEYGKD